MFGKADGDEEIFWNSAHRRYVTEINSKGFFPQTEGIGPGPLEGDIVDEDIGCDEEGLFATFDHSRIITNAADQIGTGDIHPVSDFCNEPEFTNVLKSFFSYFQLRTLVRNG